MYVGRVALLECCVNLFLVFVFLPYGWVRYPSFIALRDTRTCVHTSWLRSEASPWNGGTSNVTEENPSSFILARRVMSVEKNKRNALDDVASCESFG